MVGTISGNVLTLQNTGVITITASQAGNDDFKAAPDVSREISVIQTSAKTVEIDELTVVTMLADKKLVIKTGKIPGGEVIKLVTLQGVVLRQVNSSGTDTIINMNDVPNGIYLVSIQTANDHLVKKIVWR